MTDINEIMTILDNYNQNTEKEEGEASLNLKQNLSLSKMKTEEHSSKNKADLIEDKYCCPSHCYPKFKPKKCRDVVQFLHETQKECSERVEEIKSSFPITIFDNQLFISREQVVLSEDYISFKNQIPSINFAACWNDYNEREFIGFTQKNETCYSNIPPIQYKILKECYHMKIELFNNKFVRKTIAKVKSPYITDKANEDFFDDYSQFDRELDIELLENDEKD